MIQLGPVEAEKPLEFGKQKRCHSIRDKRRWSTLEEARIGLGESKRQYRK